MIDRSQKLQELIDDNPGIQFREIMRSSGLKNGVLSHYLKKLEDGGLVKVMRGPRQVRFYSPNITQEESIVIKALRKETPRDLLLALIKDEKLQLEKKNNELLREHKYLRDKILKLETELKSKAEIEKRFHKDIDDLNQETENLVEEIEKWQM